MMDRHDLQKAGTHPAPCAHHCEASAFMAEIRRLKHLLKQALVHVEASAEASHLLDGFKPKPNNALDRLAAQIRMELHDI